MTIARPRLPPVAILAGGLATRLLPLTREIPKSLVTVAGKPFIDHQLRLLHREGVSDVVLCVGHFGEQIRDFVGSGSKFGLNVQYAFDGPGLLGTGGALKRALALLGDTFMVLYGDSFLDIPFAPVFEAFRSAGTLGLITVYRNQGRYDRSNVVFSDGMVRTYDKHRQTAEMDYIDYGLGVLMAEAFAPLSDKVQLDLGDVYSYLSRQRQLAGFEVHRRFYEIGSPEGLRETARYIATRFHE